MFGTKVSLSLLLGGLHKGNAMIKLDRYDALKLQKALRLINEVKDYNNVPSSPMYRKLDTVSKKLDKILAEETEPCVSKEYTFEGKVKGE